MIEAELYFSHRNTRLLKLRKHFVYYNQKVTEISYSTSICSKRSPVPLSGPFKISEHYFLGLFNKLQDFETMKARK